MPRPYLVPETTRKRCALTKHDKTANCLFRLRFRGFSLVKVLVGACSQTGCRRFDSFPGRQGKAQVNGNFWAYSRQSVSSVFCTT